MSTVIGIDLGTTNCAVAHINSRGAEILQNAEGDSITPSVVQFDGDDIIVGKEAKNAHVIYPDETVAFAKRYMDEPTSLGFTFKDKAYSAIDISAIILKKLKENAEAKLDDTVEEAVITVPAYFDNVAKEATKQAAEIAGLKVLRLIMEPSSAALYYSYMHDNNLQGKRVLVYDLGGGTFDVSVVDLNDGTVNVIATEGDPKLGGKDFDERIIAFIKDRVEEKIPGEVDWDDIEVQAELYEKAEDTKRALSQKSSSRLKFKFAKKFKGEITREQFEKAISSLVYNTLNIVNATVEESLKKDGKKIDEILLVGGSTKMPIIATAIEKELDIKVLNTVNPDEVVAQGAALLATNINLGESSTISQATQDLPENVKNSISLMKVNDIVPHSLGIIVRSGGKKENKFLIKHGESIPYESDILKGYGLEPGQDYGILQITQGEDEDPKLVEVIGSTPLKRPEGYPIDQFANLTVTYKYDESGLIRAYGDMEGESFDISVDSKYKLDANEISEKREDLQSANID